MKLLMLVPSVVKHGVEDRVRAGEHPMMDYWGLFSAWEQEQGVGSVTVLDYAAVEASSSKWVQWMHKIAGKDMALTLLGFLQAKRFDVIFTNGENLGIPLGLLFRFLPRRPGHVTIGHRLSAPKKGVFFRRLKAHFGIDTVLVYAKTQRDYAISTLGIPAEKLRHIMFHADEGFFAPRPRPATNGSKNSPFLISSAGLEWRDYPTLIEAVRNMENVRVCLAAASPWSKHTNETEKVALPPHVSAQRYSYAELRDLYAASDLVVVPLYENDFQAGVTTLLEAMAMGKPVIVTQTTGQTDVVRSGLNGVCVPPGDVETLRQAIEQLRADPVLRQTLGTNARYWVEANATLSRWVCTLTATLLEAGKRNHKNSHIASRATPASSRDEKFT